MNSIKISILLMALLCNFQRSFATEEITTTNTNSTFYQFLSNHDPRYVALTGLGVSLGVLGLIITWLSAKEFLCDTIEERDIPFSDKMLRLGSKAFATLIGLICTVGGGVLIITDDITMKGGFNRKK